MLSLFNNLLVVSIKHVGRYKIHDGKLTMNV